MRKPMIIALCVNAVAWCALAAFQTLPASKAIWVILAFAGMYAGFTVDLYRHCKCDEDKKREGSS